MSGEQLLIYAGAAMGLPDGRRRQRYLQGIRNFVWFCQKNGLMLRAVLKQRQKATMHTNVVRSDMTDEGYRFFRAAYRKWSDATDKGALETRLLAETLARLRGTKCEAKPKPTARGTHQIESPHSQKSSRRERRTIKRHARATPLDFKLTAEDAAEYEACGPHVYDKADWHVEGEYPNSLPEDQAYVHTGIFVSWLGGHGMFSGEFRTLAEQVRKRKITGPQAYQAWGGALLSDMLTEQGNQFARAYYDRKFLADYRELLVGKLPSFYHVADTWNNYDTMKERIDARFHAWKKRRRRQSH